MEKNNFKPVLVLIVVAMTLNTAAFAEMQLAKHHPRRTEVLRRDRHLGKDIHEGKGHLGGHYMPLSAQDRHIRREAQREAIQRGGHITPQEQARLNRQENRLNRPIQREGKLQ